MTIQQPKSDGGRWPQSLSERDACWDFVCSLREQFGLDESAAVERAVEVLKESGRGVDAGVILRCKPRRKGPDTHVSDVGRAVVARGFVEEVDGRELVGGNEGLDEEERERAERVEIGTEAIGALFRKVIPSLPEAKWSRVRRTLYVRPGAEVVSVSGRGARVEACPGFLVGDAGGAGMGWFVRNEINEIVPVVKGAIGLVVEGKLVRTLLNATVKWHGGGGSLQYFQWRTGAGDWQLHFKTFVTYASMFCPEVTNHARGAALAELLGECRASISSRKQKIAGEYRKETGGMAGFEGMRTGLDPRKGIKLGPRKGRE